MASPAPLRFPFATRVVGVSAYQPVVRHLVEGADLLVAAEPDNPFDPNAHVITHNGDTVGYLSRAVAARMAVTGPGPWAAVVRDVFRRDTWGVEVGVNGPANVTGDMADTTPEPEPAAEVAETGPVVVARHSGRELGQYVVHDTASNLVWFRVGNTELSVPADLAEIREPARSS